MKMITEVVIRAGLLRNVKLKNTRDFLQKRNFSEKLSYYHNVGSIPLVYRTIGQQWDEGAKKFGDREAIVEFESGKRYSFGEIQEKANRLANGLMEIGLKSGDRVGIWSPNTANWVISMVAIAKAGLVSVALNPAYQAPEMAYCIEKVKMRGIIAYDQFKEQNYFDIISKVRESNKNKKDSELIVIMDSSKRFPNTFQFDEVTSISSSNKQLKEPQPDDDCNIQYTSGTTGKPKAAVLSHYNIVNNGLFSGHRIELGEKYHRICVQNPLFHVYGIVEGISASMAHGATLVFPGLGYNPVNSLKAIAAEKCTFIFGTPTMYVDLIARQRELNIPITTAEIAMTGGAICQPHLFKQIKKTFNLRSVKTIYGLTEATASAFQSLPGENEYHETETVGKVHDHLEAKIINKNGELVPFNTPGELCIRGYCTMLRYFGDEEKTKEVISNDKWFKTGDQFILSEDGYGQIVGRLKEMIIRGGENIYPKEVETILVTHPEIRDAQVIGIPDERLGEEICAFLRTTEKGKSITKDDIREFCKGQIANFKVPRYIEIVDNFPTTVSGKIQKFKLKEMILNKIK